MRDVRVRARLAKLVRALNSDPNLQDDLEQEASLHLWLQQQRSPGHTLSWYVQSCRFHIQDFLRSGKSMDSIKRRAKSAQIAHHSPEGTEDIATEHDVLRTPHDPLSSICARDIFQQLSTRIAPIQKAVFIHLIYGHSVREIARELEISHQAITYHRRKIVAAAIGLGISSQIPVQR